MHSAETYTLLCSFNLESINSTIQRSKLYILPIIVIFQFRSLNIVSLMHFNKCNVHKAFVEFSYFAWNLELSKKKSLNLNI